MNALFMGMAIGIIMTILSGIGTVIYMSRGLPPRSDPVAMECYRGDVFHSGVSRKNYLCAENLKWIEIQRPSGIVP